MSETTVRSDLCDHGECARLRAASRLVSRLADELSRIPHADVHPERRHLAVETGVGDGTGFMLLSATVQEVREQAIIDASDLEIRILPTVGPDEPDIVDRMYALPEWAQEWVAGSVVGGVCFVDEARDVWYVAMPFDVCISRIGGGTLSGEVVATKRGDLPYTRLEAAEAMAAHWARMEAEGDE